ncbi:SA1362 family protein [Tenuibacillus multivorans]|uniref:Uncharacterized protein n=1 Tax=Tenuibacillus multivorans TaxID=237069 RepID=A0A1G9Z8F4_9BACI|nr:SA1362 family protein [Tenuibacillus multivorans]GEL77355.1 hypothetical protein TMU01_15900 [Tenuibacillus multivorans]SDN17614.1 hypothetical protein SAMN05216498_1585 [Tenuibacillus multivorans]
MGRNGRFLIYGLFVLAAIGLLSQLINSPVSFFKSLLMMVGFAVVLGGLIYYFLIGRRKGHQHAKYKKAVKQSKKKYGRGQEKAAFSSMGNKPSRMQKTSKKSPHLTVIKGNKK